MQNVRSLPMYLMAVTSLGMLSGCANYEVNTMRGNIPGYYIRHEMQEADRAVEAARQAGKDKACPTEFKAAEDAKNNAYDVFRACRTEEGASLAKKATEQANALCPPQPVKEVAAPVPAPPAPQPAPPVAAPVPVPVPVKDSDGDGVPDNLDKCPGTPAGVAVDAKGCPIDTDKDGVPDYLDKCPGTPAGVAVDAKGCPIDADKDGVPDYLDKCPGTPAGAAVDSNGCPIDSDNDGVPDYLDRCPGTPAGVVVDAKGCPMEAAKKFCDKPAIIAISFDTGKADVQAKYHEELDKVAHFLKEFPNSKGTIDGYTDNVGDKASNIKLSQRRADSVRNYILKAAGIAPERIAATGYGPAKPVADNKTKEGKAKNRRIEANFTCE